MRYVILICALVISISSFAQKIKIIQGSLAPLKGQKALKVEFTYNDMIVGKDLTEEAYIKRKKEEYDAKEPGKGASWEKNWYEDRKNRFEPKFFELFQKYTKLITNGSGDPKYTMIFHTVRTEPGWNVGVARASARIDAEVTIVETADPSKIIAKITVVNAPGAGGMGYDFDSGFRIQEAYAKSGKELGKLIGD